VSGDKHLGPLLGPGDGVRSCAWGRGGGLVKATSALPGGFVNGPLGEPLGDER
jgi:hypothetical protein